MKMLAAMFASCLLVTGAALAYPTKPVRVIVPSQAGGGADIVAKALPDGYTIMFTTSALAIRDSLYRNLPYDTLRDFQPITQVLTQANVLVVHPSLPVKNVQELIAYARARPGQLNYGSGGNGTSNHLAGALFQLL